MSVVLKERMEGAAFKALVAVLAALAALVLAAAYGASPAWAANLTVTNNGDSGPGTLREAVDTANSNDEADTITFDLPQGQRTITLTSGQITFT